jgi:hypothetical protein
MKQTPEPNTSAQNRVEIGKRQGRVQPLRPSLNGRQKVTGLLSQLMQANYHTAKLLYFHRMARRSRRFEGRRPLLIYTMGKVGSSSMLHSLKRQALDRPLYHLHSLASAPLRELERSLKPDFPDSLVNLRHIWRGQFVASRLLSRPHARIQAISLIRDPVARNLSDFFQHIVAEPLPPSSDGVPGTPRWRLVSSYLDFEIVVSKDDTSALIDLYFQREWHDFPSIWIDRELEGVLDVHVYDAEFPTDVGYAIYHSDRADLLLIRLRDLNRCASEAIEAFLGLDSFRLVNANVGSGKGYVDVYNAFKSQIVFPESYLDCMYNTRFVRHFYSEMERRKMAARWAVR